ARQVKHVSYMRHKSTGPGAHLWLPRSGKRNRNLEEYNMHRADHYIASLFLSDAIAAPGAIMAIPVPQQVGVQVRVYDRSHKDYHNWDENENRAWGTTFPKTTRIHQG